jgi:hypothetical protein
VKQKHVLVVGGPSFTLDKLDKLDVRYSMVQIPPLVDARQFNNAERYAVVNYRNLDELLAIARAWHAIDPFDTTVSFIEYGLEPASRCAIDLGVDGDNLKAVLATRDKTNTRNCWPGMGSARCGTGSAQRSRTHATSFGSWAASPSC